MTIVRWNWKLDFETGEIMKKRMTARRTLTAAAAGTVAGVTAYGLYRGLKYCNRALVATEYRLRSERVPEAFGGFRIAHISDLQSEYFGEEQRELLEMVRNGNPDIIAITGDLVDRNHTDFMAALKAVSGLLKIAPVYYVNGNHELQIRQTRIHPFYEELKLLGVHVMFDRCEKFEKDGSHINIMGVAETSVYAAKEIGWELGTGFESAVLLEKLRDICEEKDNAFTIMLTHEPQYLTDYATTNADVILSGHAHGGQFRLPNGQGLYAPGQGVLPKMTSGFHIEGRSAMLVSRGLGNSVFPFRLNNRPEVVFLTLKR